MEYVIASLFLLISHQTTNGIVTNGNKSVLPVSDDLHSPNFTTNMRRIGDFDEDSSFGDFGGWSAENGDDSFGNFEDNFVRSIIYKFFNSSMMLENETITLPNTNRNYYFLKRFSDLPAPPPCQTLNLSSGSLQLSSLLAFIFSASNLSSIVNKLRNISAFFIEIGDDELSNIVYFLKNHSTELKSINDSHLLELIREIRNFSSDLDIFFDETQIFNFVRRLRDNPRIWSTLLKLLNKIQFVDGAFSFEEAVNGVNSTRVSSSEENSLWVFNWASPFQSGQRSKRRAKRGVQHIAQFFAVSIEPVALGFSGCKGYPGCKQAYSGGWRFRPPDILWMRSLYIKKFYRQIYDAKNILFAKFDEKVTADDKQKNWQHVKDFIDSLGVTMVNKQWDYAWWPNIKQATILKIDKFRKTGAEGGVEAKLTELNNAVLDIIGKDSAVINGLSVSESTFTPKSCTNSSTVLSTNEELTQVNQTSPKRI
uniref:Uncharacterized protein n=1 Tax=Romanomermis culicivorax TaxID=13658 RepID=A0A915IGS9_ROMCU